MSETVGNEVGTHQAWAVRFEIDGHLQHCDDEVHARRLAARAADPAVVLTRYVTKTAWAAPSGDGCGGWHTGCEQDGEVLPDGTQDRWVDHGLRCPTRTA